MDIATYRNDTSIGREDTKRERSGRNSPAVGYKLGEDYPDNYFVRHVHAFRPFEGEHVTEEKKSTAAVS